MERVWEFIKSCIFPVFEWIHELVEGKTEQQPAPFIVSEYLDRIEKAQLDILEQRKFADRIIILWWGFDGLRLNEDGSLEWVSRKKQKPVNQNVSCQSCQTMGLWAQFGTSFQSMQAATYALQTQMAQQTQNASIAMALQNAAPYSHYLYGGEMHAPQMMSYSFTPSWR